MVRPAIRVLLALLAVQGLLEAQGHQAPLEAQVILDLLGTPGLQGHLVLQEQ